MVCGHGCIALTSSREDFHSNVDLVASGNLCALQTDQFGEPTAGSLHVKERTGKGITSRLGLDRIDEVLDMPFQSLKLAQQVRRISLIGPPPEPVLCAQVQANWQWQAPLCSIRPSAKVLAQRNRPPSNCSVRASLMPVVEGAFCAARANRRFRYGVS